MFNMLPFTAVLEANHYENVRLLDH